MSWKWPKVEEESLARLVLDDAKSWLPDPLPFVWNDLHASADSRRELVEALYRTMLGYRLSYAPEKYSPKAEVQSVRTPGEILGPREGTCLDLSLLFCGLCMGCELIPCLVVVDGHAFVLVSLSHRLRNWDDRSRQSWRQSFSSPLADPGPLRKVLDNGTYLAVECTGFARSGSLPSDLPEGRGRDADGLLSFEAAEEAGRAQLAFAPRPFRFAIDLAVARYTWGIEPDDLSPAPTAAGLDRSRATIPVTPKPTPVVLKYLVDRVDQAQAVYNTVLDQIKARTGRPAVFFIVGDEDQEHGKLISRLVNFDLPKWLALRNEEPGVEEVLVDLPRAGTGDFDLALRRELGLKLSLRGDDPTWADVGRWLGDRRGRMLFTTTFDTTAWEQDGPARIEATLRSWESCPDLPSSRVPLVCVKVVFEERKIGTLGRLLGRRDPNAKLAAYLAKLDPGRMFPRIQAVHLKRLDDVRRVNLDDWLEMPPVREFLGPANIAPDLDAIFREAPREGLPMRRVISDLDRCLERVNRGV